MLQTASFTPFTHEQPLLLMPQHRALDACLLYLALLAKRELL
ncbi:hypothetical protein HMPREF1584_00795 [Gardnerella vaginalis JCP8481A]|uniref:Uncharacterized protein n=1 Tax=Gardnerella vaginalis TaxID=2702 RepID=A0A133NUZ1_GARVA|nr:hypothetical protein HMPREF1584_00795 [Gardnerella vaginalis JCP8481A]EPI43601.1 hypothetical protein HMPREF1585_00415 [Gardnerella vaginalis JCP8481B]KXA20101.1 hypothetical protein HMPREF3208_00940 [Gardnerella vaginalis]